MAEVPAIRVLLAGAPSGGLKEKIAATMLAAGSRDVNFVRGIRLESA